MLKPLSVRAMAASHGLAKVELLVCQALIVGFAGLLLVNVMMRYLLNAPIYYADELAIYTLIWMAFLAISVTIARGDMIALTFLAELAVPRVRFVLQLCVDLLVLAMCVVLAWTSWQWLNSGAMAYEQALTLGTVKWPFYSIVPIFFTLATLHMVANLLHHLAGGVEGTVSAELETLP
jgi:TRAP-type C4-dicarboxylate transport system permease small subunit